MCSILLLPSIAFASLFSTISASQTPQDPNNDFIFLEVEPYPEFESSFSSKKSESQFLRIAGQVTIPVGKIAGHQLFSVLKLTAFNRDLYYANQLLNDGPYTRMWISAGIDVWQRENQSSFFLAGVGINRDQTSLNTAAWNGEWLYSHSIKIGKNLEIGGGIDLMLIFGEPHFYPLLYLDWRINPSLKLKIDADFAEFRKFFGSRFCLTFGTRFNQEFYALKNANYRFQTVGVEAGIQYALNKNLYVRLKYKEMLWGDEFYELPTSKQIESIQSGKSMRLNLAYGW